MSAGSTRIGTSVGPYRLEALLGRGGMSVVYLAEHGRLGRKVALKLLAPALSEDASFRERFESESRRAAEIDHPNIIPVYDAGEESGQLYIAMRYVKGSDLRQVITRDGYLPVGRALFILEQVASALDAAHDRSLVHRDVKPANILIEEPLDRVYVTDFGIVKHTLSAGLTRTGYFVGTLDYAAPEQIEGMPVDHRTDVYALGCVLFETLSGKPPFSREAEVAVMHAHLSEAPPALTALRPDLPPALDRVIATAMAKPKDERQGSCRELVQGARAAVLQQPPPPTEPPRRAAVEAPPPPLPTEIASPATDGVSATVGGSAGPPAPPASPPTGPPAAPPRAPGRGKRPWLYGALGAIAAAAAAALVVFFVTRSDDPEVVTQPVTQTTTAPATDAGTTAAAGTTAGETVGPQLSAVESVIPGPLLEDCTVSDSPPEGAVGHAVCQSSDVAQRPDRWELTVYPDGDSAAQAYERMVETAEAAGVTRGSGACNSVTWGGEGDWIHGAGNNTGGDRVCFHDGTDSVIAWTHPKAGQDNHEDILAVAREGNSDHPRLFRWWNFWHHQIGKIQD